MRVRILAICAVLLAPAGLGGCGPGDEKDQGGPRSDAEATPVTLAGAGATFPYPLYARWFSDFASVGGVRINYRSIGSGGGLRELASGAADFAATESPEPTSGNDLVYFPLVAGAVAVAYNLPPVDTPLRLDGATLADVFLGRIARWNDPRIRALNPDASLPSAPITVAYRTDVSGTTEVATRFLTRASERWRAGPGVGMTVRWPVGVGNQGSEGVVAQVKQTIGAIGFVELTYVRQSRLPVAAIRNRAGSFVVPTVGSVESALRSVATSLPDTTEYRVSLLDAPSADAYPIASLSWLVVRPVPRSVESGRAMAAFIRWATSAGGARARELDYAPLPPSMAERVARRADAVLLGSGPNPRE